MVSSALRYVGAVELILCHQFYGKADAYLTGDTKYRHAKNAD